MRVFLYSLVLCLSLVSGDVFAMTLESGPQRVSLLELYSSEGCSSCPPADEWINSLRQDKNLWKDFVPVVFHVDYWDYLGWKDVYASPRFSQRQRDYAASWGTDSVYTPGFVKDGHEWRRQFFGSVPPTKKENVGRLTVEQNGENVKILFQASLELNESAWLANAAILSFNKRSEVQRGENAGRTLSHDFVVSEHVSGPMKKEGENFVADLKLAESKPEAIAVWVTRADKLEPVQAAGGYISVKPRGNID